MAQRRDQMTASREFFAWLLIAVLLCTNVLAYLLWKGTEQSSASWKREYEKTTAEAREARRDFETRMLRVLRGM
jgi:peptidoglycan/LPS O-acetylase OafA/YrhL